jgi:hypothetical protein
LWAGNPQKKALPKGSTYFLFGIPGSWQLPGGLAGLLHTLAGALGGEFILVISKADYWHIAPYRSFF